MSMVQCTTSFNTLTLHVSTYNKCNHGPPPLLTTHPPTHIDLSSPTHFRREEVVSVRFVEAKSLTKSMFSASTNLTKTIGLKRLGEFDRILNHCDVCRQCQCRCDCIVRTQNCVKPSPSPTTGNLLTSIVGFDKLLTMEKGLSVCSA